MCHVRRRKCAEENVSKVFLLHGERDGVMQLRTGGPGLLVPVFSHARLYRYCMTFNSALISAPRGHNYCESDYASTNV